MPSLGSGEATAVAKTTLSPLEVSAAPGACFAMRPVSNLICLPPASSTVTSCFMLPLFSLFHRLSLYRVFRRAGAKKRSSLCGYLAARELHWYRSFRVVHSSEPQTAETTPASTIVSNSGDKVLPDLARMLQPTENR